MTCTEIEELLGAYTLDAVTPEEREAIEAHIAQCPNCMQQLKEMRSVVELLSLSVPQVVPPPQLKERILSAIQAVATASSQSTHHMGAVRPILDLPSIRQIPPASAPIQRRRTGAQRWAMPLVAAAAILLLVLSGGLTAWNLSLQRDLTASRANAVTTTTYAISGNNNAPGATGQVTYIPKLNITVMVLHGLPQLQGTEVYQGWLIQGKETRSVGLLNPQGNGGDATINFSGDVKGYDTAAVSVEVGPKATPNAPKGKVIAVGPLNKHT